MAAKYQFIKDITSRNGEGSSKKLWYNGACLVSSIVVIRLAWTLPTEYGMEDWAFVWLLGVFLVCVGGFDVILEMMRLAIQWKSGTPAPSTVTVEESNKKITTKE
jgi:predicted outer membrane lipoprotein